MTRRQKLNIPQDAQKNIQKLSDEISHLQYIKDQNFECDEYNTLCDDLQMKKGFTNKAFMYDAANRHIQNEIEKRTSKLSKLRGTPPSTQSLKRHDTGKREIDKLSAYELQRQDNMRQNHKILVEMGIEKNETLKRQAKRPRKQISSFSVSKSNDMHKMNLRSHVPVTSNEYSFFSDTLKESQRKNRANQDSNTHTTTFHNPTLNKTAIDDDPTYLVNIEDGSKLGNPTYNLVDDNYGGKIITVTNTLPQSDLETASNEEQNRNTNQVKIEDITCFFDDETEVCSIKAKDLSNILIQSFPIIKSSFAKSGYKGVHKTKLGWLVQINLHRNDLTKEHQMCFCGIYTELVMATFVFSILSQNLFLASSINFLYNTLNNLKILSSGSDNSFLYT